jgi:hypothetical protein
MFADQPARFSSAATPARVSGIAKPQEDGRVPNNPHAGGCYFNGSSMGAIKLQLVDGGCLEMYLEDVEGLVER